MPVAPVDGSGCTGPKDRVEPVQQDLKGKSALEADGVSLTADGSDLRTQMVPSRRTNRVGIKERHDAVAPGRHP